jgi:enoyl-[acyl-carrier protein] reductase II
MCLVPLIRKHVSIPLIAAGGIGTGSGMLAAMALGADGVQIGSRFIASPESSAHQNFKEFILNSKEGDTQLMLKEITPVRLLKNEFYNQLIEAYENGASKEELVSLLGRGRAKKGMFMGDLSEGELEIGQVSALMDTIKPAAEIVHEIIEEFNLAKNKMSEMKF